MIFVTGDLHGDIDVKKLDYFDDSNLTKDDYLIICGDFGFIWDYRGKNKREDRWLDNLEARPYTILFIDGNHENFNRLNNEFAVEQWHGGLVHKIREHVIHLMRGQVYTIDNHVFFTFGGASSHDRIYRRKNYSWWPQELPNEEEMNEGRRNLKRVGYHVDFVITHCLPTWLQNRVPKFGYDTNRLTDYLGEIEFDTSYQHWYCGHYHINYDVDDKVSILYEKFVQIV